MAPSTYRLDTLIPDALTALSQDLFISIPSATHTASTPLKVSHKSRIVAAGVKQYVCAQCRLGGGLVGEGGV